MFVLLGLAILVGGFVARLYPLLVVAAAALATGIAAGIDPLTVVAAFGKAFNTNRYVTIAYIVLPVIGLIERAGLRERAGELIARLKGASAGRLLIAYLAVRQITAALGLNAIAGQAQTVRPLIAPMAEAAAARDAPLDEPQRQRVRAFAAATDNVGVFFGEDIFLAMSSILLIRGVLAGFGVALEPLQLSVWAIPSAVAAFLIHGARLLWVDRRLRR